MKKLLMLMLAGTAVLIASSLAWAAATFTMGYPPPGGVTFSSSDPSGGSSGNANGETFFYSGFNSAAYSQLYWGLNNAANVSEGSQSMTNMVFNSYNSTTGIATWVSTDNWTFTSGFGGNVTTATQLLVQLQPFTGMNAGFLSSGFLSPTTTKGALGLPGNPLEPLYHIVGTSPSYQATFEYMTWDGVSSDAGNPSLATPIFVFNNNNNGGPGVVTSTDFEFWSSKIAAHTVQVGGCKTNVPSFTTIQAAVSAIPPGGIVEVCPGIYPEQVKITSPLTLEGITNGTAAAAVIAVPMGGLVSNGTGAFSGPRAVQLLVQDAGPVTIMDIVVDGTNSICPPSMVGVDGIAYLGNTSSAFGKINNSAVRNIANNGACPPQSGNGIYAENGGSNQLTVTGVSIHGFAGNGVYFFQNQGGTISNNTISGGSGGVAILNAGAVTVSGNNINTTSGAGISINASGPGVKVTANKVSAAAPGISLISSNGAVVQSNVISNTTTALVLNESGGGGSNTVTNNSVNDGSCGISTGGAAGSDTFIPNTLINVTSTTCP